MYNTASSTYVNRTVLYEDSELQSPSHSGYILRKSQFVDFGTIKENVNNVLLLGVDVVTGSTMEQAASELRSRGVQCSATACLYWNPDAKLRPTFFVGRRSERAKFPWNVATFRERYHLHK